MNKANDAKMDPNVNFHPVINTTRSECGDDNTCTGEPGNDPGNDPSK